MQNHIATPMRNPHFPKSPTCKIYMTETIFSHFISIQEEQQYTYPKLIKPFQTLYYRKHENLNPKRKINEEKLKVNLKDYGY
jgi:hypothetical protein